MSDREQYSNGDASFEPRRMVPANRAYSGGNGAYAANGFGGSDATADVMASGNGRAEARPTGFGIARSDRVAYLSAALIFLVLIVRFRFPEHAREVVVELRYLLALFASCFTLGISGWFQSRHAEPTKVDAIYTIAMLVALVALWDLVLTGSVTAFAMRFSELVLK